MSSSPTADGQPGAAVAGAGPPAILLQDANREALARRLTMVRQAAPGIPVIACTSRTAGLLQASRAPEGSVALIDLCVTDRFALDRPGERLLRRLAVHPATAHVRPVAWSAHVAPEVIRGVREAGGVSFVTASLDPDRELAELRAVLAGDRVWPAAGRSGEEVPERWEEWFEGQFQLRWEPWVEPTLVRLAGGEERRAVADELVELEAAQSRNHAASRMREVARAVAGEHSNSPSIVARRAAMVLAQIAAHRPLAERPSVAVSLEHGAWVVAHAPSLVEAAGLTTGEAEEIVALHELIVAKRLGERAAAGAPPADRVRQERRWAAGRRAVALGAGKTDVDAVIDGILTRTEEALVALDDARQDELYHPEARAAVALGMLSRGEAGRVEEATVDGGVVRWRGHSPVELSLDDTVPVADLRALAAAIDRALLDRTG